MKNETATSPTSTTSQPSESPWVVYLTGKKVSAEFFLREMDEGVITIPDEATGKPKKKKTGRVIIPDEAAKTHFVEALVAKPDLLNRVLTLLQMSAAFSNKLRGTVMELAEAGIKGLNIISFPEALEAAAFSEAISTWLNTTPEKPLKSANLEVLSLLLLFGWHRQLLDQDKVLDLIETAVSPQPKSVPKKVQPIKHHPTPFDVLFTVPPTVPVLSTLITYFKDSKTATDKLNSQIHSQTSHIAMLIAESTSLNATIAELRAEINMLKDQKAAAETTIVRLEEQLVEIHDGYQYKLNELRGRVRGALQGQLTRWLQTALDASQSTPPWTEAIQERLEDALKLIEKELQWLQLSD